MALTGGKLASGGGGLSNFKQEVNKKLEQMNLALFTVVIILIVMVTTLLIDSFHFNSTTYKEYSDKIQTLNSLNETNNELMEQNKKNQDLILEQQNQLINLIKKL